VYLDDKTAIKNNCKFMIGMHELRPQVDHLFDNTFLLTNISHIIYVCDGQEILQQGCTSCLVTLKKRCSLRADSYYIAETLTGHHEDEQSIKYTVPLPVLIHFFSNESLDNIRGGTSYLQIPNIKIPTFEFFEHQEMNSFAGDKRNKINLDKAVTAVKNDKQIVNSLSEAIVLGKIVPSSNYWISWPGILSVLTMGVTVVLILANWYLVNKVRYLIIAVGVLKANALTARANTLQLNYAKGEDMEWENQSQDTWHNLFLEMKDHMKPQMVSIILAMIVLINILYALIRKFRHTRQSYLNLCFEFSSKEECCYVHVKKLYGAKQDYTLEAKEFIKHIKIQGWFKPVLKYDWSSLILIDNATANFIRIGNQVSLTWYQTAVLKRILRADFKFNPVFLGYKKMYRMQITKLETGKGEEEISV